MSNKSLKKRLFKAQSGSCSMCGASGHLAAGRHINQLVVKNNQLVCRSHFEIKSSK